MYGILLAVGAVGLQWLDYQRLARAHPGEIYVFLVALAFLALGLFIGARVIAAPAPAPFDGNPRALASLGISPRELRVLEELAAGHSNKEIAAPAPRLAAHRQDPCRAAAREARGETPHRRHRPGARAGHPAVRFRAIRAKSPFRAIAFAGTAGLDRGDNHKGDERCRETY